MLKTRRPTKRLIGTESAVQEMVVCHFPVSLAAALTADGRAVYDDGQEIIVVVPTDTGIDFTGYGYRIETYFSYEMDGQPWWVVECPSLEAVEAWMYRNDPMYCALAWYERGWLHVPTR